MTKDDPIEELRKLLKIEKDEGYVDYIRDRWSDENVLKVYHYARKIEKRRMQRAMAQFEQDIREAMRGER